MGDSQEIEYSAATFNPFSQDNIKTQESKMQKIYKENDAVMERTRGSGRASNLQSILTTQAKHEFQSGGLTIGSTSSASTATEGDSATSSSDMGTEGHSSDAETLK